MQGSFDPATLRDTIGGYPLKHRGDGASPPPRAGGSENTRDEDPGGGEAPPPRGPPPPCPEGRGALSSGHLVAT
ncbi:hypothetical protein G9A89_000563 [Geosiphon pyriformis]|nr:hypothetical protein G9A89_000563 [Geosiphon pyriformis]